MSDSIIVRRDSCVQYPEAGHESSGKEVILDIVRSIDGLCIHSQTFSTSLALDMRALRQGVLRRGFPPPPEFSLSAA